MIDRDIRDLNETVGFLAATLDEMNATKADRWQDVTLEYGDHPDETTADLSPYAGSTPVGPWEPYAACTMDEGSGRNLRTYSARCWRRPLRKVTT